MELMDVKGDDDAVVLLLTVLPMPL